LRSILTAHAWTIAVAKARMYTQSHTKTKRLCNAPDSIPICPQDNVDALDG
jgi:hypothetical protein